MFLIIDCSCKIDNEMILLGNYTNCSPSINEKSHLCSWRNTARACYQYFAKHACDFSLIPLESCNFLYLSGKNYIQWANHAFTLLIYHPIPIQTGQKFNQFFLGNVHPFETHGCKNIALSGTAREDLKFICK